MSRLRQSEPAPRRTARRPDVVSAHRLCGWGDAEAARWNRSRAYELSKRTLRQAQGRFWKRALKIRRNSSALACKLRQASNPVVCTQGERQTPGQILRRAQPLGESPPQQTALQQQLTEQMRHLQQEVEVLGRGVVLARRMRNRTCAARLALSVTEGSPLELAGYDVSQLPMAAVWTDEKWSDLSGSAIAQRTVFVPLFRRICRK